MSFAGRSSVTSGGRQPSIARESTTDSAVFAENALSGPGQSDIAFLAEIVASIKAESRHVRINKRQVQNLVKRLLTVADTLEKMPDNRPTPQLLSVFRSADLLIKCMSRSPMWVHTLKEHFVCRDRFTAIREDLKAVWHLHSTDHWERADRLAASDDEQPNAVLLFAVGGQQVEKSLLWSHKTRQAAAAAGHGAAISDGAVWLERKSGDEKEISERHTSEEGVDATRAAAAEDDIIAFYRRRHLGAWKLWYEDLDRLTEIAARTEPVAFTPSRRSNTPFGDSDSDSSSVDNGKVPSRRRHSTASAVAAAAAAAACGFSGVTALAPRFNVRRGYLFNGHPVIVKEVDGHRQPQLPLTPYTITSFVQDAVVRTRWCHPGLAQYYGGYTEKFLTPRKEASLQRAAAGANLPFYPLLPTGASDLSCSSSHVFSDIPEASGSLIGELHRHSAQASLAVAPGDMPPIVALGFVVEDVTFSADGVSTVGEAGGTPPSPLEGEIIQREEQERAKPDAEEDGGGGGGGAPAPAVSPIQTTLETPTEFVCLGDLLFSPTGNLDAHDDSNRFSLLESIDVVVQMGEILQYILLDAPNVPTEVVTAWLSVAPSNVYVAPVPFSSPLMPNGRHSSEHERAASFPNPFVTRSPELRTALDSSATCHLRRDHGTDSLAKIGEGPNEGYSFVFTPYGTRGETTPLSGPANARRQHSESPSSTVKAFPLPYTLIREAPPAVAQPAKGSGDVASSARPKLQATVSHIAVAVRERIAVKYAPPAFIEDGPCNRWRPHPCAASPPCYALAQLCLGLLTALPPYHRLHRQAELRERILGFDGLNGDAHDESAGGLPAVRVNRTQGYAFPKSLPLPLYVLLRMAMSFTPLTAEDYRVEKYRNLALSGSSGGGESRADGPPETNRSQLFSPSWAYAGSGGAAAAEEDCAYLLSQLNGSSCNVATNSSAVFADSWVNSSGGAGVAVPRVLTLQMMMEGLAVVAELLEARGVHQRERLDLSKDPVYSKYMRSQSRNGQPRRVDPNAHEVQVTVEPQPKKVVLDRRALAATFDDYGEI